MEFVEHAPRHLFFTGKGGVGKTSVACAAALWLARSGKRVLLVSTDPASNLDEVLGTALAQSPRPVPGADGLFALNLDPEAAAHAYRERIVGPYRGVLPEASVRSIEEQLSGACTVEIAAFDEFSKLLGEPSTTAAFDHVLFDTAPTGHTLRLLELPAAWSDYIESSPGGVSCLGPLAGLSAQRSLYAATRAALCEARSTRVVLVARPEASALLEAERTRAELAELGIEHLSLVLNGVFTASDPRDPVAHALEARGTRAVANMATSLRGLPLTEFPLLPFGLVGIEKLSSLFAVGEARTVEFTASGPSPTDWPGLDELVLELAQAERGVVFTMGKGGVGKTAVARELAQALRRRGKNVQLTTTDPAASVKSLGGLESLGIPVSRIDAQAETRRYSAEVLEAVGSTVDAVGRALIEEDLRSPCTEEIAVFRAFARIVADGKNGFVIIDTAPTGHTLLLLDAAEAYHREVARASSGVPEAVRELLPRLRDPDFAKVVIVTLPEATPVHEAQALQVDLMRAGIRPFAWVINQSLLPLGVTDPILAARRASEERFVREAQGLAPRVALIPFAPSGAHTHHALATSGVSATEVAAS